MSWTLHSADRIQVSIKKILNLNEPIEPSEGDDAHTNDFSAPVAPILRDGRPIWKVLVFDVRTLATPHKFVDVRQALTPRRVCIGSRP